MCGSYLLDRAILASLQKYAKEELTGETRDIKPSDWAPVILYHDTFCVQKMQWGFSGKSGLLINARAETALEKVTFKESLQKRRCLIPTRQFYEWDHDHQKISFRYQNGHLMYLAGFYDRQGHYIIITTKANQSVAPYHDRMPLILEPKELKMWFDDRYVEDLLKKKPPLVKAHKAYEQLCLFGEEDK